MYITEHHSAPHLWRLVVVQDQPLGCAGQGWWLPSECSGCSSPWVVSLRGLELQSNNLLAGPASHELWFCHDPPWAHLGKGGIQITQTNKQLKGLSYKQGGLSIIWQGGSRWPLATTYTTTYFGTHCWNHVNHQIKATSKLTQHQCLPLYSDKGSKLFQFNIPYRRILKKENFGMCPWVKDKIKMW